MTQENKTQQVAEEKAAPLCADARGDDFPGVGGALPARGRSAPILDQVRRRVRRRAVITRA